MPSRHARTFILGFSVLTAVGVLTDLSTSKEPVRSTADKVDYQRQVRPILADACLSCHGPDAAARKAKLRLDIATGGALDDRDGRRVIVPGKPEDSELLRRINDTDARRRMPPAKHPRQLKPVEIDVLRRWVAEGAKYEAHWAFAAPRSITPPPSNSTWPRNGIDSFILARLEQEGLRPATEADRTALVRRVTLDLTGLPPTVDEVEHALNDRSNEWYEKVVDCLLASPRYGERMAVDWLDAARYADSNGYQVDRDREMWPWRDWVIRAFNRNLPFDAFTIEQLAGDLLPQATREQQVATGFGRNHMLNEEGGVIPEEFLAEYVADRVETTATVWLGLTIGCARCHDHKYDPLTQKEFYGLFAFFHNVPETGLGNFGAVPKLSAPPLLKLASAEDQRQLDQLTATIRDLEGKLAKPGADVDAEQAAWEKTLATPSPTNWVVIEPTKLESKGGALLTRQADKSVLASGTNPERETYTITTTTELTGVTGLRLEAMPDASFQGNGPGRSVNGNIVLTDVRLSVAGKPVKFKAASADFSQKDFPVAQAIDDEPSTGWAIHPEMGKPHTAIFELSQPLTAAGPLVVTLDFQSPYAQHVLGRFRLSLTNGSDVHARPTLPPNITSLLAVPAPQRNAAQQLELTKYYREQVSPSQRKLRDEVARSRQAMAKLEGSVPTMMVMSELPQPRDTFVLIRGQYNKKGDKVSAGVPAVLNPLSRPTSAARPNRLDLAKWLVDPANPLTARVAVNRYWQAYFGVGLVRTAEDFGTQGEPPTHADLLDWLATEFVRSGWDVKAMQRLIVTSATYRQSSKMAPKALERDPENRLLARGPRHRLPAEMLRDQALAVSGLLVNRQGGPPVRPYHPSGLYEQVVYQGGNNYQQSKGDDLYRRSLYTYWKRSVPHPAMLIFDAPFRETCAVRRARTSTPLQALNLMNDPTYVEAARFLGQRMVLEGGAGPEDRIRHGFRLATGRFPRPRELAVLTAGWQRMLQDFRADTAAVDALLKVGERPVLPNLDRAELAAYTTVASTLLNLDEVITKE